MFGKKKQKKTVNTEVDLVAFISLLSVCICFLLLTTVWIQIGSMNVKQAIGGQSQEGKPKPEMWVVVDKVGSMKLQLRHSPRKVMKAFNNNKIDGVDGKPNLEELGTYVSKLKGEFEDISMALIRPASKTQFEDIIQIMDVFREGGIEDLGVTPL
ncbi:MAG: biopolymer transporter ExbD [Bdellovibrionales bacterium]|nr:biopolymer transporter ExbD [Bdellovibrionales bacterium]NQZ18862.1 biopolymer transporter ExbD [Bdellovibrionales bacterium]